MKAAVRPGRLQYEPFVRHVSGTLSAYSLNVSPQRLLLSSILPLIRLLSRPGKGTPALSILRVPDCEHPATRRVLLPFSTWERGSGGEVSLERGQG